MNVFMIGWEFPPFISGGLGTACYGLTKAMNKLGIKVSFVLPRAATGPVNENLNLISPACKTNPSREFENVTFKVVESPLVAYSDFDDYQKKLQKLKKNIDPCNTPKGCPQDDIDEEALCYGHSLYLEVHRYAGEVARLAANENADLIHAHDWMTFPAGTAAAKILGKPLVVHVHSTEFDRSGENVNQVIYDIEKKGMHSADRIITVSAFTRNTIIKRYGIPPEKVEVVYNGVEQDDFEEFLELDKPPRRRDPLVLFLGRITMQKGPEYFISAAKKVLEKIPNVKFVMAGTGDMMHRMVAMAANAGLGKKVLFTGFLKGEQVKQAYKMADLYVMPSVSEPFGITPLEAIKQNVPVLISNQSGISEILLNALRADFWDINELANKIIAVLKYKPLRKTLITNGTEEVKKFKWDNTATMCMHIYEELLPSA